MYIYKAFSSPDELADFLNGAIFSNPLPATVFGLHGLTVVINNGSSDKTTTFADATGAGLKPAQILAQIHATDATMSKVMLRSYGQAPQRSVLVLAEASYATKAGTANAILGLPSGTSSVTAITKTNIVWVTASISGNPRYDVLYVTA
ncbi:hypothetical protein UFOVP276_49 [uncultured Caudovirales phage]|uniref:Uncharacterized protein n=1 Tax=uncultured Caudovirales phage TaxID=2100421 RepID=A0A6J5LPU4_9CAUD|nr:hypothetical protein UFOVP127_186 [uncultured Caudovirales phage]CAB4135027.1 hypothetical protein UFOVP276_49 [uncultured Caudovirales phage]